MIGTLRQIATMKFFKENMYWKREPHLISWLRQKREQRKAISQPSLREYPSDISQLRSIKPIFVSKVILAKNENT